MPYGRILKANMVPSGVCLLHFLVNSQIFSEIKLSVKNRYKRRNVHRFTITVRRMYIFCKPCPTACMTLSFRCGSGKRLTELVRIVQRFAHGTWPSVWREPSENTRPVLGFGRYMRTNGLPPVKSRKYPSVPQRLYEMDFPVIRRSSATRGTSSCISIIPDMSSFTGRKPGVVGNPIRCIRCRRSRSQTLNMTPEHKGCMFMIIPY